MHYTLCKECITFIALCTLPKRWLNKKAQAHILGWTWRLKNKRSLWCYTANFTVWKCNICQLKPRSHRYKINFMVRIVCVMFETVTSVCILFVIKIKTWQLVYALKRAPRFALPFKIIIWCLSLLQSKLNAGSSGKANKCRDISFLLGMAVTLIKTFTIAYSSMCCARLH